MLHGWLEIAWQLSPYADEISQWNIFILNKSGGVTVPSQELLLLRHLPMSRCLLGSSEVIFLTLSSQRKPPRAGTPLGKGDVICKQSSCWPHVAKTNESQSLQLSRDTDSAALKCWLCRMSAVPLTECVLYKKVLIRVMTLSAREKPYSANHNTSQSMRETSFKN